MLLSETRRRDTLPHGMTDEQGPAAPESVDDELARLRRLAVVDELLTTLVGVLDVRDALTRVSEVAGRVLTHDAIALSVFTEDRQHAIPFATAGPAAVAHPLQPSDSRNRTAPVDGSVGIRDRRRSAIRSGS